jgi:hypothetical protein
LQLANGDFNVHDIVHDKKRIYKKYASKLVQTGTFFKEKIQLCPGSGIRFTVLYMRVHAKVDPNMRKNAGCFKGIVSRKIAMLLLVSLER